MGEAKATLFPFVLIAMADALFANRAETSCVLPVAKASVPPPNTILPVPSAPLTIVVVPPLRLVEPE